jgi:hypothetical protein
VRGHVVSSCHLGRLTMPIRVTAGPGATETDRRASEVVQDMLNDELERTREQAANWRTGLFGLLGLITSVSFIKGRASIDALQIEFRIAVALATLFALVTAVLGSLASMRASYGYPRLIPVTRSEQVLRLKRTLAQRSRKDLRAAVWLTLTSLTLVVTAIGLTWFGPAS